MMLSVNIIKMGVEGSSHQALIITNSIAVILHSASFCHNLICGCNAIVNDGRARASGGAERDEEEQKEKRRGFRHF